MEVMNLADGAYMLATPKAFNFFTMIELKWINWEPGRGFFSGHLDLGTVVRELPDLPEVLHLPAGAEWDAIRTGEIISFVRPPMRKACSGLIQEKEAA